MAKKKKSFKEFMVTGSKLASMAKPGGPKIKNDKELKAPKPMRTKGGLGSKPSTTKVKNDKKLPQGTKEAARRTEATQAASKNAKLSKTFDGARTYKDANGNIRPTKEWAAYLKKNDSRVVSKKELESKPKPKYPGKGR